jgi:hypothetical protein
MYLRMNTIFLAAGLLGVCGACKEPLEPATRPYKIRVRCQTQEGLPVPGILLSSPNSAAPLASDASGVALLKVNGHEGEEVPLRVEHLPAEYVVDEGAEPRHVVLKQLVSSVGEIRSEIAYDIRVRRIRENYVVLIAIDGAAGRAVAANGTIAAYLNSRGAAALRYPGKPGEELKITVMEEMEHFGARDLNRTFSLPEAGSILTYRIQKDIKQPSRASRVHQKRRPQHHHQSKNASPVQIPFTS